MPRLLVVGVNVQSEHGLRVPSNRPPGLGVPRAGSPRAFSGLRGDAGTPRSFPVPGSGAGLDERGHVPSLPPKGKPRLRYTAADGMGRKALCSQTGGRAVRFPNPPFPAAPHQPQALRGLTGQRVPPRSQAAGNTEPQSASLRCCNRTSCHFQRFYFVRWCSWEREGGQSQMGNFCAQLAPHVLVPREHHLSLQCVCE